jgi:hypothetical protein
MRELRVQIEKPPVVRPKQDRDLPLEEEPLGVEATAIEDYVQAALVDEPRTLSHAVRMVLPKTAASQAFLAVGRIAEQVVLKACPESALERPWVNVSEEIEIEDWDLRWKMR